jgi:hypothetical protein
MATRVNNSKNKKTTSKSLSKSDPLSYYTPAEIAAMWGTKPLYIYKKIWSGELQAIALSRGKKKVTWRVSQASLEEFLKRRAVATTEILREKSAQS